METVAISGNKRTETGKRASKAVRYSGHVPCVLYGGENDTHFSVKPYDLRGIIYTPDFKLAELDIDGTKERAILKDVQFDPVTDEIIHVDFLRLIENVPVKIEVPIRFRGVSPGVKAGGKLIPNMRRVKIKATPDNIVNELHVDVSGLSLGQSARVRDLDPVEGVEIMSNEATPVVLVDVPRALRSAESKAEEEAAEEGAPIEETTAEATE